MIAPSGWLERIVVMTIVVQAYSNNEREGIDKQGENLSMRNIFYKNSQRKDSRLGPGGMLLLLTAVVASPTAL